MAKKMRWHLPDDNNAEPITVCVPVPNDQYHRRAFLDAIYRLTYTRQWQLGPTDEAYQTAKRWEEIYYEVSAKLGNVFCDDSETVPCVTYRNTSSFIQYGPNDPRYTPDYVPPNYASPPWYFATTASNLAYGSVDGDIITTFERLASGPGIPEFPWIEIPLMGAGEIELHMRNLVLGGLALLTRSDDALYFANIDLNKDLVQLPPETGTEVIIEHTFTGPGPHWIKVVMIPLVDAEDAFIAYGGGLSHIVLCGDLVPAEEENLPLELNIVGDELQLLYDGVAIDTVPKADLQAFLDRWVDTAGDTMTGTLTMQPTALNANPFRVREPGGFLTLDSLLYSGGFQWLVPSTRSFVWGSGTMYQQMFRDYVTVEEGGVGAPQDSVLNVFARTHATLTLSRRVALTKNFLRITDENASLLAAIDYLGQVKALALDGYDYSSTAWRKQFSMAGFWSESTDAVRTGGVSLSVSDYGGDVEIMRADYGPYPNLNPLLSFFDGVGSRPVPIVAIDGTDLASKLALKLQAYGLIESYLVDQPAEVAITLTDQEKCNVAYYVATALANLIAATFDDMTNVTADEVVSNIIDSFDGIGSVPANVVYEAFQAAYAERVGIVDDLTDPSVLADMLITADYDLTAFLAAIELYAWAWGGTPEFLVTAITEAWNTVVPSWIAEGRSVDSAACPGDPLSCAGGSLDYRWGQLHGTQLFIGLVGGGGVGLSADEFDTDQWAINARFNLDGGCTMEAIEVDYFGAGSTLRLWVRIGDVMQLHGPYFPAGGTQTGYQTGVFDLSGQGLDDARQIEVEFTTQGNVFASTINHVRWGSEV